ncbi:unnamed protein product [Timema podura]|uniref:C-type lectin domain-containing protein n=1 Tax=Timema podura TaxID=61482 RepID=A0ABN7NU90_TIMPD|nr:unnamed protein product [Timema podura]
MSARWLVFALAVIHAAGERWLPLPFPGEPEYVPTRSVHYKFQRNPSTFKEAVKICRAGHSHLPIIHSFQEWRMLTDKFYIYPDIGDLILVGGYIAAMNPLRQEEGSDKIRFDRSYGHVIHSIKKRGAYSEGSSSKKDPSNLFRIAQKWITTPARIIKYLLKEKTKDIVKRKASSVFKRVSSLVTDKLKIKRRFGITKMEGNGLSNYSSLNKFNDVLGSKSEPPEFNMTQINKKATIRMTKETLRNTEKALENIIEVFQTTEAMMKTPEKNAPLEKLEYLQENVAQPIMNLQNQEFVDETEAKTEGILTTMSTFQQEDNKWGEGYSYFTKNINKEEPYLIDESVKSSESGNNELQSKGIFENTTTVETKTFAMISEPKINLNPSKTDYLHSKSRKYYSDGKYLTEDKHTHGYKDIPVQTDKFPGYVSILATEEPIASTAIPSGPKESILDEQENKNTPVRRSRWRNKPSKIMFMTSSDYIPLDNNKETSLDLYEPNFPGSPKDLKNVYGETTRALSNTTQTLIGGAYTLLQPSSGQLPVTSHPNNQEQIKSYLQNYEALAHINQLFDSEPLRNREDTTLIPEGIGGSSIRVDELNVSTSGQELSESHENVITAGGQRSISEDSNYGTGESTTIKTLESEFATPDDSSETHMTSGKILEGKISSSENKRENISSIPEENIFEQMLKYLKAEKQKDVEEKREINDGYFDERNSYIEYKVEESDGKRANSEIVDVFQTRETTMSGEGYEEKSVDRESFSTSGIVTYTSETKVIAAHHLENQIGENETEKTPPYMTMGFKRELEQVEPSANYGVQIPTDITYIEYDEGAQNTAGKIFQQQFYDTHTFLSNGHVNNFANETEESLLEPSSRNPSHNYPQEVFTENNIVRNEETTTETWTVMSQTHLIRPSQLNDLSLFDEAGATVSHKTNANTQTKPYYFDENALDMVQPTEDSSALGKYQTFTKYTEQQQYILKLEPINKGNNIEEYMTNDIGHVHQNPLTEEIQQKLNTEFPFEQTSQTNMIDKTNTYKEVPSNENELDTETNYSNTMDGDDKIYNATTQDHYFVSDSNSQYFEDYSKDGLNYVEDTTISTTVSSYFFEGKNWELYQTVPNRPWVKIPTHISASAIYNESPKTESNGINLESAVDLIESGNATKQSRQYSASRSSVPLKFEKQEPLDQYTSYHSEESPESSTVLWLGPYDYGVFKLDKNIDSIKSDTKLLTNTPSTISRNTPSTNPYIESKTTSSSIKILMNSEKATQNINTNIHSKSINEKAMTLSHFDSKGFVEETSQINVDGSRDYPEEKSLSDEEVPSEITVSEEQVNSNQASGIIDLTKHARLVWPYPESGESNNVTAAQTDVQDGIEKNIFSNITRNKTSDKEYESETWQEVEAQTVSSNLIRYGQQMEKTQNNYFAQSNTSPKELENVEVMNIESSSEPSTPEENNSDWVLNEPMSAKRADNDESVYTFEPNKYASSKNDGSNMPKQITDTSNLPNYLEPDHSNRFQPLSSLLNNERGIFNDIETTINPQVDGDWAVHVMAEHSREFLNGDYKFSFTNDSAKSVDRRMNETNSKRYLDYHLSEDEFDESSSDERSSEEEISDEEDDHTQMSNTSTTTATGGPLYELGLKPWPWVMVERPARENRSADFSLNYQGEKSDTVVKTEESTVNVDSSMPSNNSRFQSFVDRNDSIYENIPIEVNKEESRDGYLLHDGLNKQKIVMEQRTTISSPNYFYEKEDISFPILQDQKPGSTLLPETIDDDQTSVGTEKSLDYERTTVYIPTSTFMSKYYVKYASTVPPTATTTSITMEDIEDETSELQSTYPTYTSYSYENIREDTQKQNSYKPLNPYLYSSYPNNENNQADIIKPHSTIEIDNSDVLEQFTFKSSTEQTNVYMYDNLNKQSSEHTGVYLYDNLNKQSTEQTDVYYLYDSLKKQSTEHINIALQKQELHHIDIAPQKQDLPQINITPEKQELHQIGIAPQKQDLPQIDITPQKQDLPQREIIPPKKDRPQIDIVPKKQDLPQIYIAPQKQELHQIDIAPKKQALPQAQVECVALSRWGQLVSVSCELPLPFICETDPYYKAPSIWNVVSYLKYLYQRSYRVLVELDLVRPDMFSYNV